MSKSSSPSLLLSPSLHCGVHSQSPLQCFNGMGNNDIHHHSDHNEKLETNAKSQILRFVSPIVSSSFPFLRFPPPLPPHIPNVPLVFVPKKNFECLAPIHSPSPSSSSSVPPHWSFFVIRNRQVAPRENDESESEIVFNDSVTHWGMMALCVPMEMEMNYNKKNKNHNDIDGESDNDSESESDSEVDDSPPTSPPFLFPLQFGIFFPLKVLSFSPPTFLFLPSNTLSFTPSFSSIFPYEIIFLSPWKNMKFIMEKSEVFVPKIPKPKIIIKEIQNPNNHNINSHENKYNNSNKHNDNPNQMEEMEEWSFSLSHFNGISLPPTTIFMYSNSDPKDKSNESNFDYHRNTKWFMGQYTSMKDFFVIGKDSILTTKTQNKREISLHGINDPRQQQQHTPLSLSHSSSFSHNNISSSLLRILSLSLYSLLFPLEFSSHFHLSPPRGILLSGLPGVGKLHSVRLVCEIFGVVPIEISPSTMGMRGVTGENEKEIRNIFEEIYRNPRQSHVIVIDEIDVLCPQRGNSLTSHSFTTQLLSLLDGMNSKGNSLEMKLLIFGLTNFPNALDAAMRRPGRFDREINIKTPNQKDREHIIRQFVGNYSHQNDDDHSHGTDNEFRQLSLECNGFVGADISALVSETIRHKITQLSSPHSPSSSFTLSALDLLSTIQLYRHSSSSLREFKYSVRAEMPISTDFHEDNDSDMNHIDPFHDVGGLQEVKFHLIRMFLSPLKKFKQFSSLGIFPPRGLLFYGPPGVGKSKIVRSLCRSLPSFSLFIITPADVFSQYYGEGEKFIQKVFQTAKETAPAIIYFDEIDSMVGNREHNMGGHARILTTILTEMDGITAANYDPSSSSSPSSQIYFVGSTNRLSSVDVSLLRPQRFDVILHVKKPNAQERNQIIHIYSKKLNVSEEDCVNISIMTEGMSGAQIESLVREAAMEYMREKMELGDQNDFHDVQRVKMKHFDFALRTIKQKDQK